MHKQHLLIVLLCVSGVLFASDAKSGVLLGGSGVPGLRFPSGVMLDSREERLASKCIPVPIPMKYMSEDLLRAVLAGERAGLVHGHIRRFEKEKGGGLPYYVFSARDVVSFHECVGSVLGYLLQQSFSDKRHGALKPEESAEELAKRINKGFLPLERDLEAALPDVVFHAACGDLRLASRLLTTFCQERDILFASTEKVYDLLDGKRMSDDFSKYVEALHVRRLELLQREEKRLARARARR